MKLQKENISTSVTMDALTAKTATTAGDSVDTLGYNDGLLVIVTDIKTSAGNETYTVKMQESDTGTSGWTDIDGLSVSVTADGVSYINVPGLHRDTKRYIRCHLTVGGTSPSFRGYCLLQLSQPYRT